MADRKRTDELVVITKTYDLNLWSCNHTGKSPEAIVLYSVNASHDTCITCWKP
jgi:hypothetical protein